MRSMYLRLYHNAIVRLCFYVGVVHGLFYLLPSSSDSQSDPIILIYISMVFTLAVAIMLIYTRKWNTIGQGLLATMIGDSLLYARTATSQYDIEWLQRVLRSEFILDSIRASFVVGATLLFWGIAQWVREENELNNRAGMNPDIALMGARVDFTTNDTHNTDIRAHEHERDGLP